MLTWRCGRAPAPSRHSRARRPQTGLIHHSDHGVQYLSIRYGERLSENGVEASVGSIGDSYDNAMAETIIELFKAEVIPAQFEQEYYRQQSSQAMAA